jgi:hypothetical protein
MLDLLSDMTSPLTTTITGLEDKILETITSAQQPVVEYVKKAVDLVEDKLPENLPELPFASKLAENVPTASEIVDTQFAFAKRLLDAQYDFTKAILGAAAPLLREQPKPAVKVAKATKAA